MYYMVITCIIIIVICVCITNVLHHVLQCHTVLQMYYIVYYRLYDAIHFNTHIVDANYCESSIAMEMLHGNNSQHDDTGIINLHVSGIVAIIIVSQFRINIKHLLEICYIV